MSTKIANKEISPQGVALDDCQGVISRDFGSSRDLCFTSTLGSTLRSTLWSTVHQSWLDGPQGLKGSPLNRASVLYHLGLYSMKMLCNQVGSNGFSELLCCFFSYCFQFFLTNNRVIISQVLTQNFWVAWKQPSRKRWRHAKRNLWYGIRGYKVGKGL